MSLRAVVALADQVDALDVTVGAGGTGVVRVIDSLLGAKVARGTHSRGGGTRVNTVCADRAHCASTNAGLANQRAIVARRARDRVGISESAVVASGALDPVFNGASLCRAVVTRFARFAGVGKGLSGRCDAIVPRGATCICPACG
jgi:hypothetical protein